MGLLLSPQISARLRCVRPTEVPLAAAVLSCAGVAYRLHHHPPARTEAELHVTGLDIHSSAKTLAFHLDDGRIVLAAIPGPARLRYGNLARALGVSRSALRPATPEDLADLGMEPGGVSPICDDASVLRVLHHTLLDHRVLYCGSGSPEVTVEIAAADLAALSPATTLADLCSDTARAGN